MGFLRNEPSSITFILILTYSTQSSEVYNPYVTEVSSMRPSHVQHFKWPAQSDLLLPSPSWGMAFVDLVNLLPGPLTNGQNISERDEREEMWVSTPLLPRSWDAEGGCVSELTASMSVGWPHTLAYSLALSVPPWAGVSPFSARFHPAAPEGHWTHGWNST